MVPPAPGADDAAAASPETEGHAAEAAASPETESHAEDGAAMVEAKQVRQMFDHFDSKGEGLLALEQFKEVLTTMGMGKVFSASELDALTIVADTNGDGFVDFQEFLAFTNRLCAADENPASLLESTEGVDRPRSTFSGLSNISGMSVLGENSQKTEQPTEGADAMQASEPEEDDVPERTQTMEAKLRRQLIEARARAEKAEAQLAEVERLSKVALQRAKEAGETNVAQAERRLEEEMEASTTFWCDIAKSSATPKLGQCLDLDTAELLGNGRYGFVFKAQQRDGGQSMVVKLLSLRWAHVAAKEWGRVKDIGEHPNLVQYSEVMLHADDDRVIRELLDTAQRQGRLHNRNKRQIFPDRYICFMQEFMNRGTVQDWMDKHILLPGGLLATLQCVASALAHMHSRGITHNDIKPENVMLKQEDADGPRSEVRVKLGDFGLAARSNDTSADFMQLGMTVVCMVTGEHFGTRKFSHEILDKLVGDVAAGVRDAASSDDEPRRGRSVGLALAQLPRLLRQIFSKQVDMDGVRDSSALKGWDFFDGECLHPPASKDEGAVAKADAAAVEVPPLTARSVDQEKVLETAALSARRAKASVEDMDVSAPEDPDERMAAVRAHLQSLAQS